MKKVADIHEIQNEEWKEAVNLKYLHMDLRSIANEDTVKLMLKCIKLLNQEIIDIPALIRLIHLGLDKDMSKLRPLIWRLLLGYLPPQKKNWATLIEKNRVHYQQLREENDKKQQAMTHNDHPLSRNKDSNWNNYFQEQQLWNLIEKDVIRTRQKELKNHDKDKLTRIIFLWCKLNKAQYVQGINEIIALIYYAFVNDDSDLLRESAESDTFYCFSILMSTLKHNFQSVNQENQQFKEKVRSFNELLKKIDKKLFDHLVTCKIDFTIFCWKWFIAQLAQDFEISDTLRIWDVLNCQDSQSRQEMLFFICISILLHLRDHLIDADFGQIITTLQQLDKQNIEIGSIMERAYLLQKDQKKNS